MNSTAKITSLVAVLVLCCAGLAGSAYAYNATYVDTIDSQPIEDVFMVVSATKGEVSTVDVDVEYNTVSNTTKDAEDKDVLNTYYQLVRATVNDKSAAPALTKNTSDTTARIYLLVDTVTVKAFGDDATLSKIEIASCDLQTKCTESELATKYGITAFVYLSKEALTATSITGSEAYADLAYTQDIVKETGKVTAYAYLVIDVNQLTGDACPISGYDAYKASDLIGNTTIPGFTIAYKATGEQKEQATA